MVRTQIQLTEEQVTQLKRMAVKTGGSMSQLIRSGVDSILRQRREATDEQRRQRALAATGSFHSGTGDLAQHHDEYFADSEQNAGKHGK